MSNSGRHHLRFVARDSEGNQMGGIFFEGFWAESTINDLKGARQVRLYGKLTIFGGKPSIEVGKYEFRDR